jgi:hypothetical protein
MRFLLLLGLVACPKANPTPVAEPPLDVPPEEPLDPSLADGIPRDGKYVLVSRTPAESACEILLRDRDGLEVPYSSGFDFCSEPFAEMDGTKVKVTFSVAKFQSPDCDANNPCDLLVDRFTVSHLEATGKEAPPPKPPPAEEPPADEAPPADAPADPAPPDDAPDLR